MLKLEFDGVIDMKIREVNENKKQFIALLLLADEQENMIDHYLEKGTMYVLEDGNVKAECVVTDEDNGILEIKNIAVDPKNQGNGYGKALMDFLAEKYAEEFDVKNAYGSADEMFDDENIDIVYIATPHNSHYEFLMKALQSGKHVFCEKAITVNDTQLEEAVKLAKKKNLVICDGMTLYHMPVFKKMKEIVDSGKLGPVKMIQVNFGSCKEYDVTNRFFSKELAGGALLDIGVYATSFSRFFMKSKPNSILTTANYFETGVDETSGIILRNPDGQMAVMALTMRAKQPKRGVVACEDGFIEIYNYPRGDKATIVYTNDGHTEPIEAGEAAYALDYEVEDMQNYVLNGGSEEYLTYSRDVMSVLTDIRKQWGMIYPFE